ncbi:MAG: type 1 glutamine amidotransferase domain-containing protein [Methyloceanibacter sp.]
MTADLHVEVHGGDIVITLPGSIYAVTYHKPANSAKRVGAEARADDFDALLLPGGVMNPDTLRIIPAAIAFVKAFVDAGKPAASICHGPWTLIESGAARGRHMTSWPSLRTDLGNAGAQWVDQEVVVDKNVVTSRKPDDIPAFNREMINLFAQARGRTSHAI